MSSVVALALACGLFAASAEPAPLEGRVVELNQATLEELQRLPGIGPRKAEAILELRKKRQFTRVTQLLEVKGVGRKTLERLKPWVRVTAAPQGPAPIPSSTAIPTTATAIPASTATSSPTSASASSAGPAS